MHPHHTRPLEMRARGFCKKRRVGRDAGAQGRGADEGAQGVGAGAFFLLEVVKFIEIHTRMRKICAQGPQENALALTPLLRLTMKPAVIVTVGAHN